MVEEDELEDEDVEGDMTRRQHAASEPLARIRRSSKSNSVNIFI